MTLVKRTAIAWTVLAASWCLTASAVEPSAAGASSPFDDMHVVPADVTFYLHIDDAGSLRRELADRPIGRWLGAFAGNSSFGKAWTQLADASGLQQDELFDALLGRRFTLVTRTADGATEWAMLATVEPETFQGLRRAWRLQRQLPRHGLAISALPEQDIIVAEHGRQAVFGSRAHHALFDVLITSLDRPVKNSLADADKLAQHVESMPASRCGVYLKHNDFVGGWSLMALDVSGDSLKIRHEASFKRPPFQRPVTQQACDFTVLGNFDHDQLLTVMEPTDIGVSRVETYAMQVLGQALTGAELNQAIGHRRIIVIGEEDGRLRDVPEDILAPVPTVCVEVDAKKYSIEQLDQQMSRLATKLNEMDEGSMLVDVPPVHAYRNGHPRSIDVSEAVSSFSGGFPIMKTWTLNWDLADGTDGVWCVIAGSAAQLESVRESLQRDLKQSAELHGTFDSVGSINGMRLGRQLENWSRQADTLVPPDQQQQFRQAMGLLAGLLESTERARWTLARPDTRSMRLEVDVTLRDSPTADSAD